TAARQSAARETQSTKTLSGVEHHRGATNWTKGRGRKGVADRDRPAGKVNRSCWMELTSAEGVIATAEDKCARSGNRGAGAVGVAAVEKQCAIRPGVHSTAVAAPGPDSQCPSQHVDCATVVKAHPAVTGRKVGLARALLDEAAPVVKGV